MGVLYWAKCATCTRKGQQRQHKRQKPVRGDRARHAPSTAPSSHCLSFISVVASFRYSNSIGIEG